MARVMGLPESEIKTIRRGALIHDIGKIGVPDAVLLKPGKLTKEEREVIERHPMAGYEMLADIPYLQREIEIVLGHQEKWDGTGYPREQKGEEITLGARIFMIADTFDALTSDRVYRKGCTYEEAREIIDNESGKQFDPKAVEAFLSVPPEEWVAIRKQVMDAVEVRREKRKALRSKMKVASGSTEKDGE
jgi:HD-GYP domain-containing protein (c-di-GMP phosphodiesterase class II)